MARDHEKTRTFYGRAGRLSAEKKTNPTEVLEFQAPQSLKKDRLRLENFFFQIDYPKCFSADANEPEGEKLSGVVNFTPTDKCSDAEKSMTEFGVSRDTEVSSGQLADAFMIDVIYKQKAKIGGADAMIIAGLLDLKRGEELPEFQVRWKIDLLCPNGLFYLGFAEKPGQASLDRIEKKDYSLPKDMKDIVSSFSCSKTEKEKPKR